VFTNEEELNRLIAKLPIDTRADPARREALRRRMPEQFAQAQKTARPAEPQRVWRFPTIMKPIGIAAAVLAAAFGLTLTVWIATRPQIALADVQQKLAAVPVIAFRMEMSRPGFTPIDAQTYLTEDSIVRFEMGEFATLIDFKHGRRLDLMPRSHFAIENDIQNLQENQKAFHRDWLADLRRIVGSKDARPLGTKTVDGTRAVGWQVNDADCIPTVWAYADTAELVRVEFQRDQMRTAFSQFRYDVDIDKAKLSLTAPPGYTVRRVTIDASRPSEPEVVLVLRIWAMANGHVFPDNLDALKFAQAANKVDWDRMKDYIDGMNSDDNITQVVQQAFSWLAYNPGWRYAGAGVKMGDAETPIFWYKPDGSSTYRVIYGDLHIADAGKPPDAQ